jgi:hypothetical protein
MNGSIAPDAVAAIIGSFLSVIEIACVAIVLRVQRL